MKDSIHKYFQVGTIRWMSYPRLDAVEAVRRIASDDYFDAIEVRHCVTDEEREELEELGLAVTYTGDESPDKWKKTTW